MPKYTRTDGVGDMYTTQEFEGDSVEEVTELVFEVTQLFEPTLDEDIEEPVLQ
jgi:hypothetical protein